MQRHSKNRRQCEDRGRIWIIALTSKGTSRIVGCHHASREAWIRVYLRAFGKNQPCRHLDFGLWPLERGENKCLFLSYTKFMVVTAALETKTQERYLYLLEWLLPQVYLKASSSEGLS